MRRPYRRGGAVVGEDDNSGRPTRRRRADAEVRALQRMAVCAIPGEMRGHDARFPVHSIRRIMSPYFALVSPHFRPTPPGRCGDRPLP